MDAEETIKQLQGQLKTLRWMMVVYMVLMLASGYMNARWRSVSEQWQHLTQDAVATAERCTDTLHQLGGPNAQ